MTDTDDTITYYWSRCPGKFVNKMTGKAVQLSIPGHIGPQFTGTVREWYETLMETMIDVSNKGYNMGYCSKETPIDVYVGDDVRCIIECSVLYHPNMDDHKILCQECSKTITEHHIGTLGQRFAIHVRKDLLKKNEILIGHFGKVIVVDMNIL